MTAETDLLPLPERFSFMEWETHMRNYARACVSSATEALRRDRDDCLVAREHYAGLYGEQRGRAERLAEALRDARSYIDVAENPLIIAAIDAALDQETTNG